VFLSAFINIILLSSTEIAKTYLSLQINLYGAVGTDEARQSLLESPCLQTLFISSLVEKKYIFSAFFLPFTGYSMHSIEQKPQ